MYVTVTPNAGRMTTSVAATPLPSGRALAWGQDLVAFRCQRHPMHEEAAAGDDAAVQRDDARRVHQAVATITKLVRPFISRSSACWM